MATNSPSYRCRSHFYMWTDHNPSAGTSSLSPPPPLFNFVQSHYRFHSAICPSQGDIQPGSSSLIISHIIASTSSITAIVIIVIVIAIRRTHLLGLGSLTSWLDVIFSVHSPSPLGGHIRVHVCLTISVQFYSSRTKQFNQPNQTLRDTQIGLCGFRAGFLSIASFINFLNNGHSIPT